MKIFPSIFAVSITLFFFFFSISVAYSWIFYLSATIHKDYMFLFCNSLLIFICLNSRSRASLEKGHGQELAEKKQAPPDRRRLGGEAGREKEMRSLPVEQGTEDWLLIAGDHDQRAGKTLSVVDEETTCGDDYDEHSVGDGKTLYVKETRTDELYTMEDDRTLLVSDELEVVEDNKTLTIIVETQDDQFQVVEDDKTLSITEETQDNELEMLEDCKTPLVVEETQNVESKVTQDDKILSVIEKTHNHDKQEQRGIIDTISLEELNRKCEEFIKRMKEDIRVEILTIQCH